MNGHISSRMRLAQDAWGNVPDWIAALVTACDAKGASQNKVAQRLGITGGAVSALIRNSYKADSANMAARVRAVYLPEDINCPALGHINTENCMAWRDSADSLSSSAPITVRMFRACRDCPRFSSEIDEGDTK